MPMWERKWRVLWDWWNNLWLGRDIVNLQAIQNPRYVFEEFAARPRPAADAAAAAPAKPAAAKPAATPAAKPAAAEPTDDKTEKAAPAKKPAAKKPATTKASAK